MRILTFLQNSLHCGPAHSGELERPAELSAQTGPVSTEATVGWSCLVHSRTARGSGTAGVWQRQLVVPWGLWLPVSTSSMLLGHSAILVYLGRCIKWTLSYALLSVCFLIKRKKNPVGTVPGKAEGPGTFSPKVKLVQVWL